MQSWVNINTMTREEILRAVDELFELPAGTLHGPEKLQNIEGWNSMAMIGFIALADTNNGVKLSPRALASAETVDELLSLAKVE